MSFDLSDYVEMFREEADGYLVRLNEGLLALERDPSDAAVVNDVFRAAHSLKGTARMLELSDIADVAHALEDLLDGVRSGRYPMTPALADALLAGVDAVADLVRTAGSEQPPAVSPADAVAALVRARDAAQAGASAVPPGGEQANPDHSLPSTADGPEAPSQSDGPADLHPRDQDREAPRHLTASPQPSHPILSPQSAVLAPATQRIAVPAERLDRILRLSAQLLARQEGERTRAEDLRLLVRTLAEAQAAAPAPAVARRVLEARLLAERLARTAALDVGATADLVEELYYEASRARMVPVEPLLRGFQRAVRDAERALGKQVDFQVLPSEAELDKHLLDALHDPLLHLVRNGVDHGIEAAEVRRARAKPEHGTIRLSARTSGDRVLIEVEDDGGGLDPQRFREAAVRRGLMRESAAAALSDDQAVALMFRPGFSTRDQASQVSGRGVGMDVVKTTVDALEGQVRVTSRIGEGTRFTLSVPLSLAAMRVLLVQVRANGGPPQRFALPASAVERCEWLPEGSARDEHGQAVVLVDEQPVPVRSLGALLGAPPAVSGPAVQILDGDSRLLLTVDELLGETMVVVEPLGPLLRGLQAVGGGAILPDGGVALLLRVPYLLWGAASTPPAPSERAARRRVLVVDDVMTTREVERSILASAGYQVETAPDGQAALDRLRDETQPAFDALVTDLEMPRLDGLALVARVRAGGAGARHTHLPIVVVSSRERAEDRAAGVAAGANVYLPKSVFDQGTLTEALVAALRQQRALTADPA